MRIFRTGTLFCSFLSSLSGCGFMTTSPAMKFRTKGLSLQQFRENYFTAGSRPARFLRATGAIVQVCFQLAFGGIWSGFSGGMFFPAVLGEKSSEIGWGPIVIIGGFFCIGLGILGFGLFGLVSVIRTIIKAPPVGSVPVASQTDIITETTEPFASVNSDRDNPFRAVADDEISSNVPETLGSKIFLAIFGLIFFCAGTTVSTIGINKYLEEETAAETWISAPCKIVSAKLEDRRGSKGNTTYSPKIVYEFSVNGKTFRGDKIFISLNSASSNYDKEKQRLTKYKGQANCWFNPEDPTESALIRPTGGLSLRKIVLAVFGLPFMLVGGGIFVGGLFGNFFKKKKNGTELPSGALRPENGSDSPILGFWVMLGFATVWNLIVFVVGAGFCSDGFPGMFPAVILSIFAVVGIGLIFVSAWVGLGIFNPQYLLMLFPEGAVVPGGNVRLTWRVLRGDPARVQVLKLDLVRLEKTSTYVNGKPKEKDSECIPVYATTSRTEVAAGTVDFCVPASLSPGKWVFRLSAKTGILAPNVRADFSVTR